VSDSQHYFPVKRKELIFMGLDIRWPIGLMFTMIGALMVIYGLVTGSDAELYKSSLGMNVNLFWGLLLLVFGGWMLIMAWRAGKQPPGAPEPKNTAPRK
jgi:protein-S-isoprenylcysteine O-methyltransferase Ste14